ncbi:MAG: radical SAM protein [Nitrospiria bacterium]
MPPFSALYIENQCRDLARVRRIIDKCPDIPLISCTRYGEVFNPKAQNFRLQKKHSGLILAKKHQHFILPAPPGYGFGNKNSYYFSHMLNCPYDCRYCFLQGMYASAHYLLFVNFEDFEREIEQTIQACGSESCYFYSGYDSDSFALEQFSGFAKYFLPFFKRYPQACLELRTKSAQIRSLLQHQPIQNCVVAMSFSPENIAEHLEHRVPSLSKRIGAAQKLQQAGWKIALRFEPLIYQTDYEQHYQRLYQRLFEALNADQLHSVSIGFFRMPKTFFRNIAKLYPDERLYAGHYVEQDGMTSYPEEIEEEMISKCETALFQYIPRKIYYRCEQ